MWEKTIYKRRDDNNIDNQEKVDKLHKGWEQEDNER